MRRGYVSTNREAFDRYLDTEEFRRRVTRFKADARTCVEAIKAADGELEELVSRLKDWGLDAIECYYPKHSRSQ